MAVRAPIHEAWPPLGTYLNQRTGAPVIAAARAAHREINYYTHAHPLFESGIPVDALPSGAVTFYEDRHNHLGVAIERLSQQRTDLAFYRVRHRDRFPREAAARVEYVETAGTEGDIYSRLLGIEHYLADGGVLSVLTADESLLTLLPSSLFGIYEFLSVTESGFTSSTREGYQSYLFRKPGVVAWAKNIPGCESVLRESVRPEDLARAGTTLGKPPLGACVQIGSGMLAYLDHGVARAYGGYELRIGHDNGTSVHDQIAGEFHRVGFYLVGSNVVITSQEEDDRDEDTGIAPFALQLEIALARRLGALYVIGCPYVTPVSVDHIVDMSQTFRNMGMERMASGNYALDVGRSPLAGNRSIEDLASQLIPQASFRLLPLPQSVANR